jgi:TolB-like protein/DNA-binding winged helix-turn-helix (wHTH) protein/Tfp pilus assembly protein PilF
MPDGTDQSTARGAHLLRIGDWKVEPALNRVSTASRNVKLEPKAMALLAAVWPGVIVGDDSLTQAIIKLRKALGDTSDAPAYIETIAKGGYRLIAPVSVAPAEPNVTEASSGLPERPLRTSRRNMALAAGAALIALVAWAGASFFAPSIPLVSLAPEARSAAQPSVRIAPFQALGSDPDAALLAQGMTADLITDLSKVSGLALIADTLTGPTQADAAASERPSVQYVISGSVQRVGDRLRLHVHLAEGATGRQLWSERYDRPATGLFALQDEIVPQLLRTLPGKVTEAELQRVARHHTRNLAAYEYYQRGRMALLARQQEENELARSMFGHAIELDASFALAYAALAQSYAADHRYQWTPDRNAALERAFELARTAHELNPDVRETYWVLALVHLERGRHRQALRELETVLALYPSFADAYALMGGIYAYLGEPARTLQLLRTAIRLQPDAGYLYYLILGRAYFGLGELARARVNLERAIQRNPVNLETRVYLAAVYAAIGNTLDAAWEAEEIRTLQPDFATRTWLVTHPLRDGTARARLIETLSALGL